MEIDNNPKGKQENHEEKLGNKVGLIPDTELAGSDADHDHGVDETNKHVDSNQKGSDADVDR